MKTFDINQPEDILKELTYSSYAHNRDLGCSAIGLQNMGFKKELEDRYREEQKNENVKIIEIKPTIERN